MADPAFNPTQQNAFDAFDALMAQYGLSGADVTAMAKNAALTGQDSIQFIQSLRGTDTYKQRFPGMETRRKAGLAPITEADYVNWESTGKTLMKNAGLPAEFYDTPADFTQFISSDVSPSELKARINDGYVAAMNAPPDVRNALQQYYGATPGHLAAFFLDPDKATPLIQRQYATAQIGGASTMGGFGGLSAEEAGRLQGAGVSAGEVQQRAGTLGLEQQLLAPLPGEQGQAVGRETEVGFLQGLAPSEQLLQRRAQQRQAEFAGGGRMAAGQAGTPGLAGPNQI
jgi:hypothetical protein